jgi:hypothetical protein
MSGKLSTKDIKVGGEGVAKTLEPGSQKCKINNVALEDFKYKEGAYNVLLSLESESMGDAFEGFFINKDKPELGRHAGKVGTVKLTEWAFADGETKSGIAVSRDKELLKALKQLCISLGCDSWLDKQDNKHDTVESLFKAFGTDKPYKDTLFNFCIAGKEYQNKAGYNSYDLYLPKYSKDGVPVESLTAEPSKLIKFAEGTHIKRKAVTAVSEFGDATDTLDASGGLITNSGADFDL